MKTTVILAVCVLMATVSFAQNQKFNEVEVTAPKFQSELYKSVNNLLNSNLEYPSIAIDRNIQGTEIIKFLVTTEGKLTDFKIVNSLSREIDREVLRVLRSTNGKWIPGSMNGIQENMEKEISVSFYLGPDEFVLAEANSLLHKGNKWMFTKNNPKKAIYYFNKGVKLLPYDETLLEARALCRYKLICCICNLNLREISTNHSSKKCRWFFNPGSKIKDKLNHPGYPVISLIS